jgi:hypothetical protein
MTTPKTADDASNKEEAQIAQINEITERLSQLKEQMEDALTPVRTTSFNGFGTMLLDYRPVEDGHYEATRWITALALPIIPLSVWKIQPKKYKTDQFGEQQSFYLISKSRLTISRILMPYLMVAIGALPFLLAYYFLDLTPVFKVIDRAIGTWAVVGLIILLIILVLVWIGFIFTRFHNVEKAYKN